MLELGEEFKSLQERRVQVYAELNDAHKKYLQSGPEYDFSSYKQEVSKATGEFKSISTQVIEIQNKLDDDSDLRKFIQQVQDQEKEKLKLTVELQLAKQKLQDDESANTCEVKKLTGEIAYVVDGINDALEEIRYILADLRESATT